MAPKPAAFAPPLRSGQRASSAISAVAKVPSHLELVVFTEISFGNCFFQPLSSLALPSCHFCVLLVKYIFSLKSDLVHENLRYRRTVDQGFARILSRWTSRPPLARSFEPRFYSLGDLSLSLSTYIPQIPTTYPSLVHAFNGRGGFRVDSSGHKLGRY